MAERFSRHAHEQMLLRGITSETVMDVVSTTEEKQGVILDYSTDGRVVGIEILNASKQVGNPAKIEYEYA